VSDTVHRLPSADCFSAADLAELDALVDGLIRGVSEHRKCCAACAEAGSAIYCRAADTAIRIFLDWQRQRAFLTRATHLRALQNELDEQAVA
jgi:hypothetical protein